MEQETVTLPEAAAFLATTEMRVLMLLKHRRLQGVLKEGEWRIVRQSLENCDIDAAVPEVHGCRSSCTGCGAH